MQKIKCVNCRQLFILPERYSGKTIKCSECGSMNPPIPIPETPPSFSVFRLPMDKFLGYLVCSILGNTKRFVSVALVLILGVVAVICILCRENPGMVELQHLNTQASQWIYKNQPEEAMKIYDQIQERLSNQGTSRITHEWTQRIKEERAMAAAACERNQIREYQLKIVEAETLMKNGKQTQAAKILTQSLDELDKSPWKGNPTQRLMVKIQRIQQEMKEKKL